VEFVYPVEALIQLGALALQRVLGHRRLDLSRGWSGDFLVAAESKHIFACFRFSWILATIFAFLSPSATSFAIARLNFSAASSRIC
jgi:hypothetical protein